MKILIAGCGGQESSAGGQLAKEKGVGCAWWVDPEKFLDESKRRGVIAIEKIEKF